MATLRELDTVYSLNDVYQLYDIVSTDNYNSAQVQKNIKKSH